MLLIFKFSSDKLSLENLAISYKHRITLYYPNKVEVCNH